jgi:hypothetical protein
MDSQGRIWKSTETGFMTSEKEPDIFLDYIQKNNLTE